jgi:Holliday junction resolvasome RuvABC endonuclease subunit
VALLALAGYDVTLAEYSPVQIKSVVVGTGTADKRQITPPDVAAVINRRHNYLKS